MITLVIVIVTALTSVLAFRREELFKRFDLSPARIVHQGEYYRIFTHAFLHVDYWHLGINMLVLYSFGTYIEARFAQMEAQGVIFSATFFYLLLYVGSIVVASVSTVTRYRNNANYSAVGASGAVYGVLLAFGMLFPNTPLFIIPIPFPIKAKWLVIGFGALELFLGVSQSGDNIAHFAHLGGMIFGFILIRYWNRFTRNFY